MQIIHLALLRTSSPGDAVVLSQCSDLAQFGFFERPTVRQMLQFFAKTVCGRVSPGQRVSVDQEEMEGYRVHAHVRARRDALREDVQEARLAGARRSHDCEQLPAGRAAAAAVQDLLLADEVVDVIPVQRHPRQERDAPLAL